MMKRTTLLLTAASCFGLCFGYAHNSFADYNIRPHILIRAVGGTFSSTHTSHFQKQPLSSLKTLGTIYPTPSLKTQGGVGEGFTTPLFPNSPPPVLSPTRPTVRGMSLAAIMPMMTGMGLPVGQATAMIMIWIMKNVAARKATPKPPVPKVRNLPTPALMIIVISKNVFPPVLQIM